MKVHILVFKPNCQLNIKSTYCVRWRPRWRWRRRRRKLPFWTTTAVTGLSWIDVWAGIFKANGQFSIAASASSKAAAGRAAMATATFYQRNGAYATYKGGYVLIKNNGILLLLPPTDLFDLHLSVLCVRGLGRLNCENLHFSLFVFSVNHGLMWTQNFIACYICMT